MAKGSSQNSKKKYESYKSSHKREKNKIQKIMKHFKSHPNDVKSSEYIQRLTEVIKK